ncbi:unnamed protein product [Hydatigera taeniaeformis]|uniref:TAFII55_N domain-containing protein n=1 Tax=Hydatigena taeniaeformis TaxID=6205 RepID=A0A0R3XCP3_HYDTA|nr:unnamed protein product [Hydatigera taeniaeformis]
MVDLSLKSLRPMLELHLQGARLNGTVSKGLNKCRTWATSPISGVACLSVERQKLPSKRIVWLVIENIPVAQEAQSLSFKNADIVRWLDFDHTCPESEPPTLPADEYLHCETLYARLISSPIDQAEQLQHRPRDQVIENFDGPSDEDLSVVAGEVVYLLHECSNTHFMAMKKKVMRDYDKKKVTITSIERAKHISFKLRPHRHNCFD